MTTPGESRRFPGFDVLGQARRWDDVTAGIVLARLEEPAPLRFFTPDEAATAGPLLDRLLGEDGGQDDEPRVPVLSMIDERLAEHRTDGWRHEDMPHDDEAWRSSLIALDEQARAGGHESFASMDVDAQRDLLDLLRQDLLNWPGPPALHIWDLWMRYACTAFYSHPWAWNEIGFGGPAYPRGYKNIGVGKREPWEVAGAPAEAAAENVKGSPS